MNFKPIPVYKQPFKWRQSITTCYQELNWKSILRYPFLKYGSDYAFNDSFLFDKLIIGSNPFLNLLLLYKISCQYKNKNITIGILNLKDSDFWPYHQLLLPDVTIEICNILKLNIITNDIYNLINAIIKKIKNNNINIVFINNNNLIINYYKNDLKYNANVFHLNSIDRTAELHSNKLISVIRAEENIKSKINDYITPLVKNNFNSIDLTINKNKSFILLTKDVILSSLPFGWLNVKTINNHLNTEFLHCYSKYSFGSAKNVNSDVIYSTEKILSDIKYINTFNF